MIHLEVAVAAPLDHTLTYALVATDHDDHPGEDAELVGRRVIVPLGRQRLTGYVLTSTESLAAVPYQIRKIFALPEGYPLFHANAVPFFRWIAEYYQHPIGLVIKAALPGGLAPKSVSQLVTTQESAAITNLGIDPVPEWLQRLISHGELSPAETARLMTDKTEGKTVRDLIRRGIINRVQVLQKDSVKPKTEIYFTANLTATERCECREELRDLAGYRQFLQRTTGRAIKKTEARAFQLLESLGGKQGRREVSLQALKVLYPRVGQALLSLAEKGLVATRRQRVLRNPFGESTAHRLPVPKTLTRQQREVLDRLLPALRQGLFAPFLLHGVTGSGKTEVYLHAAEATLAEGRDVLILVPEIALATQLESQLLERFGEQVVLQHSGLTAAEKLDQYYLALTGRARVVVGARSAVFAPLANPGLIIVDEEHDGGFKQDDGFCYHGRDLAVLRGRYHQAVVILGSATPSITSYAHTFSGKYQLLQLTERVGKRSLPKVEIVNLDKDKGRAKGRIIGSTLQEKLSTTLAGNRQAILLLNRRGFSAVLLCQSCGTAVQCSHCHVSMTVHKGKDRLICHYCGYSQATTTSCTQCRSTALLPVGFGTERVEEEVVELFPTAKVCRIDSDTAGSRQNFKRILTEMHNGQIDILIGTQMIAKGHHFPNVTLVGVVWADGGMNMPDFRAAERTFQLITQVIGRAGRGDSPGEVVIQTMRPDHYALGFAKEHQYLAMYQNEMRLRRHPAFPPYVRLVALRVEAKVEALAQQIATRIARFCREQVEQHHLMVETLGPAPAPLDKIKDFYRWQLLLKGQSSGQLQQLCAALRGNRPNLVGHGCRLVIDVDPENMM
jgi:primosomal protein N' (replication factor Y) (superfamily II helicase)